MRIATTAAIVLALTAATFGFAPAAMADAAPPPVVGQCTNDPAIDGWILEGGAVDCATPHTGQTVQIGAWISAVSPAQADELANESAAQKAFFAQMKAPFDACRVAANDFLGSQRSGFTVPSQFFTNVTGPDDEQWAAGQRWVRCDIVAETSKTIAGTWKFTALPPPAELAGIMRTPLQENPFAMCGFLTKTRWGSIACNATAAKYLFAAIYMGKDLTWSGSEKAMYLKMTRACVTNPSVTSVTKTAKRVQAWLTGTGKLTAANLKTRAFYCAIAR